MGPRRAWSLGAVLAWACACGGEGGTGRVDGGRTGSDDEATDPGDTTGDPAVDAAPGDSAPAGDAGECRAGELRCAGTTGREQCAAGGTWVAFTACAEGEICARGTCGNPCALDGKFTGSAVGCEFWSVDLGQWHVREGDLSLDPSVSVIPHAVLIGNPGPEPATIQFDATDGTPVTVTDPVVPAGSARSFLMPVLSQQETGVTRQSIRVRSSSPVVASQFNPANNAPGFALHSTDASLLLPANMLGTMHVVISNYGVEGFMGSPPSLGYFTVVAASDGQTTLSVLPAADTVAGGTIAAHEAGARFSVTMQPGDVLTLNAVPRPISASASADGDLTGTIVVADRPVAVFGGHQCMVVVGGNCDHLETQLLPVERLGARYLAVPFDTPTPESVFRVVAAQPGTVLSTEPPIPGLDGAALSAGEWVEAVTSTAFELTATRPVAVAQFIAGNTEGDSYLVDTSMTVLIPVEQYRNNYPILIPEDFPVDRLQVLRPAGVEVTINGRAVSSGFRAIGGGAFEVADVEVDDGVQLVESTRPFGLISYGYGQKVSYALPGGVGAPSPGGS